MLPVDATWKTAEAREKLASIKGLLDRTIERCQQILTDGNPTDRAQMVEFSTVLLNELLDRYEFDADFRSRTLEHTNPRVSKIRNDINEVNAALARNLASMERFRELVRGLSA